MLTVTPGISYIDLQFHGSPRVVAAAVLHASDGVALVDPGPTSTLPVLEAGLERASLSLADVTTLLLTHIHLDHAGASGTLAARNPALKIYVHAKGAAHLSNPEKLLASAARLYGDRMGQLWGEVRPVPESALVVLEGGERIVAGNRQLEVQYTPGHASHHVSYFDREEGIAFVGDTAGVKLVPRGDVMAPTPPPDIDLETWQDSLLKIERWHADTLFLTHFGPATEVTAHLSALRRSLQVASELAKRSLAREGTDQERETWFADECRRELRRRMNERDALAYEVAGRFDLNWRGLARYWRKELSC
jgi:glyoxylase-like metal-dependent hydrolase (beta-lactamase superfamily II)